MQLDSYKEGGAKNNQSGIEENQYCGTSLNFKKRGLPDLIMKIQARKATKCQVPICNGPFYFDSFQVVGQKFSSRKPSPFSTISPNETNRENDESQIKNQPLLSNLTLQKVILKLKTSDQPSIDLPQNYTQTKSQLEDTKIYPSLMQNFCQQDGNELEDDEFEENFHRLSPHIAEKPISNQQIKNSLQKKCIRNINILKRIKRRVVSSSVNSAIQRDNSIDPQPKKVIVKTIYSEQNKKSNQQEVTKGGQEVTKGGYEVTKGGIDNNLRAYQDRTYITEQQNRNSQNLEGQDDIEKMVQQLEQNIAFYPQFSCKMPVKTRKMKIKKDNFIENVIQEQRKISYIQNKIQIGVLTFYSPSPVSSSNSTNNKNISEYLNQQSLNYNKVNDNNYLNNIYSGNSANQTPRHSFSSNRAHREQAYLPTLQNNNQQQMQPMSDQSKDFLKFTYLDKQYSQSRNGNHSFYAEKDNNYLRETTSSLQPKKNYQFFNLENERAKSHNESPFSSPSTLHTKEDLLRFQNENERKQSIEDTTTSPERNFRKMKNNEILNSTITEQKSIKFKSSYQHETNHQFPLTRINPGILYRKVSLENQNEYPGQYIIPSNQNSPRIFRKI